MLDILARVIVWSFVLGLTIVAVVGTIGLTIAMWMEGEYGLLSALWGGIAVIGLLFWAAERYGRVV